MLHEDLEDYVHLSDRCNYSPIHEAGQLQDLWRRMDHWDAQHTDQLVAEEQSSQERNTDQLVSEPQVDNLAEQQVAMRRDTRQEHQLLFQLVVSHRCRLDEQLLERVQDVVGHSVEAVLQLVSTQQHRLHTTKWGHVSRCKLLLDSGYRCTHDCRYNNRHVELVVVVEWMTVDLLANPVVPIC